MMDNRWWTRLVGLALLCVGCAPDARFAASGPGEPVWPGEEWPVSTPEAEGLDPAAIDSLVADIDAGRFGLIDHFLLIRHGRVIADRHWDHGEEYARILAEQEDTVGHPYNYDHPDWHPYYRDTGLHTLQSVTKSVTSVAFGIAVGKILREATGRRADAWAEEHLFRPIGIRDYYWKITPDGEADTEGGLYLAPHDLARIAYLMLRGGEWDGRRIVSREWVRASTSPVIPDLNPGNGRDDGGYGYQWWVPFHEEGETRIFSGNGYGGQFLHIVPEHDLILLFNGWTLHARAELSSWTALQDRILPAIRG